MAGTLRQRYPEAVFEGRRTPEQIGAVARTARMLVMPSRYPEPFGLVAAEALWSGLPVIAAETAFLAPDIAAAKAGLAVNPRDADAFARAIAGILNDDGLCRGMSMAAFTATRAIALSPAEWTDRLLRTYRGVLALAGRAGRMPVTTGSGSAATADRVAAACGMTGGNSATPRSRRSLERID